MAKILWVEDENDSYKNASYEIEKKYEVTHVTTCAEALEQLRHTEFQLYIVDLIIPGGEKKHDIQSVIAQGMKKYYGLDVLEAIVMKSKNAKIIVFSVANDITINTEIESISPEIHRLWKYEINANELTKEVSEMIS